MRREIENALELAKTIEPADLPYFLGDLEVIRVTALSRLTTPAAEARPDELPPDHLEAVRDFRRCWSAAAAPVFRYRLCWNCANTQWS